MKGFKRGMNKLFYSGQQIRVYRKFEDEFGSVYSQMGNQVRNIGSDEKVLIYSKKKPTKTEPVPLLT